MTQNNHFLCLEGDIGVGCKTPKVKNVKTLENRDFWRELFATNHHQLTLTGCEILHPLTPPTFQTNVSPGLQDLSSHLLHLLTPNFEEIRYFYQERAAIYEYEAGKLKPEAEHLACQDTLVKIFEEMDPQVFDTLNSALLKLCIE